MLNYKIYERPEYFYKKIINEYKEVNKKIYNQLKNTHWKMMIYQYNDIYSNLIVYQYKKCYITSFLCKYDNIYLKKNIVYINIFGHINEYHDNKISTYDFNEINNCVYDKNLKKEIKKYVSKIQNVLKIIDFKYKKYDKIINSQLYLNLNISIRCKMDYLYYLFYNKNLYIDTFNYIILDDYSYKREYRITKRMVKKCNLDKRYENKKMYKNNNIIDINILKYLMEHKYNILNDKILYIKSI